LESQHLAILGMSFTGSTIVSYALGALPGCSAVNEAHWLLDRPSEVCARCGDQCPAWSVEFRRGLLSTKAFYSDLRHRVRADVLITCDKDPEIYDRIEPAGQRSYLMLYRDPLAQAPSALKAAKLEGSHTDLDSFLNYWVDKNLQVLAKTTERGGGFLMRLEDFQAQPAEAMEKLCRAFGLPYTTAWKMYWMKSQHPIGGNFNPWSTLKDGDVNKVRIVRGDNYQRAENLHKDSAQFLDFLDSHRLNIRQL